jgi:hypothetical protein
MNKKQKIITLIGMVTILTMSLFPPWRIVDESTAVPREKPAGYYCLFSPPEPPVTYDEEGREDFVSMRLDMSRLAVQWISALFLMAGALYLTHTKGESDFDEEDWEE